MTGMGTPKSQSNMPRPKPMAVLLFYTGSVVWNARPLPHAAPSADAQLRCGPTGRQ